ncbi:hypothetical protein SAMN05216490_0033 [Mucilaginibacter mallensis]|uniref:Peptidase C13 family protein n=1 Tax=Mucilaginibacter mallensis TaxID=652787 RepID=A0A1H1MAP3_MUCMA|nr:hypothetical protein [Mucilaginibacter mallensis]SDR83750.1 hypothetical protein SAMN05216490_0033 [Mucilaginibacter mallensis]
MSVGNIKHIIVIQSLFKEDFKSGSELYHDVIERRIDLLQDKSIKMTHKFYDIKDKISIIEIIKYIQANARYMQGGILIHLETHGSKNLDGLILTDGTLLSWAELIELFRPINIDTCNKLYITMATCFGRYLYKGVEAYAKSPYSGYISASKEVTTNEVIQNFELLFESLIQNGNLITAYQETEIAGSDFYYKDSETTFKENVREIRNRMRNEPDFLYNIVDDESMRKILFNKSTTKEELDYIAELAFTNLVQKQKEAFNFSNCD